MLADRDAARTRVGHRRRDAVGARRLRRVRGRDGRRPSVGGSRASIMQPAATTTPRVRACPELHDDRPRRARHHVPTPTPRVSSPGRPPLASSIISPGSVPAPRPGRELIGEVERAGLARPRRRRASRPRSRWKPCESQCTRPVGPHADRRRERHRRRAAQRQGQDAAGARAAPRARRHGRGRATRSAPTRRVVCVERTATPVIAGARSGRSTNARGRPDAVVLRVATDAGALRRRRGDRARQLAQRRRRQAHLHAAPTVRARRRSATHARRQRRDARARRAHRPLRRAVVARARAPKTIRARCS